MITPLSATATLERARAALQNGKGAGLPELLAIIETISTNLAEVTIQELADLIEKDAAVLARIVQIANTLPHNPSFTPLSSLTHAIHQIGFSRVRSLTLSIMLVENAGGRNPPEQREAAAQALCAGLIAQGCAQKFGYVDPEAAFAAATLRNFGYIILPAVSLEHYQEAMQRLKERPEDIAFRGMFGITPLDLGRKLLVGARLPEEFMKALRDVSPEAMGGTATLPETRLLAMADFGTRIARAALDGTKSSNTFGEETRGLAQRFRRVIPDALDYIPEALAHADSRLSSFLGTAGVVTLPTASLNRIRARVQHVAPDTIAITPPAPTARPAVLVTAPERETFNTTLAPALGEAAIDPLASPAIGEPTPRRDLESPNHDTLAPTHQAAPEIIAAPIPDEVSPPIALPEDSPPSSQPPFETAPMREPEAGDPWRTALSLVRDSFGAQECWHFSTQPGSPVLSLDEGVGERWSRFQLVATVRPDERTVFGVCFLRREAVVIHDLSDPKLKPYLPAWMLDATGAPPSFVLIPMTDGQRTTGLVLIGWHSAQRITLNKAQLELARQTLDTAHTLRHSAAA
ncbi:MAG: HDOD domain-containing protein [Candidatus Didemnitutus sp.]|nr:HDOD domain-containing protein [Candidatus Didemnitutus sp.]